MSLPPEAMIEMQPVPSPCVNVCRMDPASGLCAGCRRTLDEIARWSTLDDLAKRRVWEQLESRGVTSDTGSGGHR